MPAKRGTGAGKADGANGQPSPAVAPSAVPNSRLAVFRAAASLLAERGYFASQHGLTFDATGTAKRDTYAALGYKRKLTIADYVDRHARGGVAARIVEAFPRATWRGGGELIEDEDPQVETAFESAWNALDDRLGAWPTFLRADILAGLGRFGVVLIGAPGEPESELPRGLGPKGVAYLAPYGEAHVAIDAGDLVKDAASPRWGLPERYRLSGVGPEGRDVPAHWTRILHVMEDNLASPIYGRPRLEAVWNLLDDLDKVIGAGAEAFWLRAHPGLAMNLDPGLALDAAGQTALSDEVEEYLHGYRRVMRLRGVEVEQLAMTVASIQPNVDSIVGMLSATTGIPQRILTGSERGELASSQDRSNWQERVSDRRAAFAEEGVVRQLVDRLIEHGALPEPAEGYEVRWPEVRDMPLEERALVAVSLADVNLKAGRTVVTPDEIRDRILGLPPLEEVAPEEVEDGLDSGLEGAAAQAGPFVPAVGRRRRAARHGTLSIVPPTATSGGCAPCS